MNPRWNWLAPTYSLRPDVLQRFLELFMLRFRAIQIVRLERVHVAIHVSAGDTEPLQSTRHLTSAPPRSGRSTGALGHSEIVKPWMDISTHSRNAIFPYKETPKGAFEYRP